MIITAVIRIVTVWRWLISW